MIPVNPARRTIGNILIVVGLLVVLAGCSMFVRQQVEGQQLRAELQATPVAEPTALPTDVPPARQPTASPAPATASPTATLAASPAVAGPTPTVLATVPPTATAQLPAAAVVAPAAPVRIVIPDLKLDGKVVEMGWAIVNTAAGPQSEWVIPKNAAGHHINSAALGETGNIVISGHNNIEGKVFEAISLAWDEKTRTAVDAFTDRSDILKGRKIQLYSAAGQAFDFTITDFVRLKDTGVAQEQRLKNAQYMEPTADARLTLITCWPPWGNSHRLIVLARPAQP